MKIEMFIVFYSIISMLGKLLDQHWPNIQLHWAMLGFPYWANISPMQWPNIRPMSKLHWANVGPSLATALGQYWANISLLAGPLVVRVSPDCLLVRDNSANLVWGMVHRMSSIRSLLLCSTIVLGGGGGSVANYTSHIVYNEAHSLG